jgi:hypothetical protein
VSTILSWVVVAATMLPVQGLMAALPTGPVIRYRVTGHRAHRLSPALNPPHRGATASRDSYSEAA